MVMCDEAVERLAEKQEEKEREEEALRKRIARDNELREGRDSNRPHQKLY